MVPNVGELQVPVLILVRPIIKPIMKLIGRARVERYSPKRKAEFLLSNIDASDYRKAREGVTKLGVDPDSIPHRRPQTRP